MSHGCIRLSNKDALRLFHNVQVGTEVVIVGGEDIPQQEITPEEARRLAESFRPSGSRPVVKDPLLESWQRMTTKQLSLVLQSELWENPRRSRWPEVAHLLSDRGMEGDESALVGLLSGALDLPSADVEREFRTFLADAFSRGGIRTVEALGEFAEDERVFLAAMIVDATMDLYHGDLEGTSAPWPTRRVPRAALDSSAHAGWTALREAEVSFGSRAERRTT